jgi:hypothetical protein
LAIRRRSVTQVVGYTKRKREITRERDNKKKRERNTTTQKTRKKL